MSPKGIPSNYLIKAWIFPDGKNHIQVLDAPAVCNTDHYLMATNDREGLSVGKEGTKALIRKDSIRRS